MQDSNNYNFMHYADLANPLNAVKSAKPVFWLNPLRNDSKNPEDINRDFLKSRIKDASDRFKRFAPLFQEIFPETKVSEGIIESSLIELKHFPLQMKEQNNLHLAGKLFLKDDARLPVAGSIKARGGIHAVLCVAESILRNEKLFDDLTDYRILKEAKYSEIFKNYTTVVSSTGNLALSIGISSLSLGLNTVVFMSRDAKAWKKDLLRKLGADLREVDGAYGEAVAAGRNYAAENDNRFFIDDENSEELFFGYAVAAERLAKQLKNNGIIVDDEHPLFLYLPCGVGGGPGGIATGLELIYGENVHCFFGEPVATPAALLGLATGLGAEIDSTDIGLANRTSADGLAVSRMSNLVFKIVKNFLAGVYTVRDESNYKLLEILRDSENIFLEPSSLVALAGPYFFKLSTTLETYLKNLEKVEEENITHIVWGTGGGMVPDYERKDCIETSKNLKEDLQSLLI